MSEFARVNAVIKKALRESRQTRRHPAEVTADRLADTMDRYPDDFDGSARDDIAHIRFLLQEIADRERRS